MLRGEGANGKTRVEKNSRHTSDTFQFDLNCDAFTFFALQRSPDERPEISSLKKTMEHCY